jgi:hypothetical protein
MDLAEAQWKKLKPLLVPKRRPDGRGRPWRDAQAVLNGMGILHTHDRAMFEELFSKHTLDLGTFRPQIRSHFSLSGPLRMRIKHPVVHHFLKAKSIAIRAALNFSPCLLAFQSVSLCNFVWT